MSDNAATDAMKSKNATLHDVAAQAGVSLTTAAAILRNAPGLRASVATRQRVIEVSASLGYRRNAVAASLKAGKTSLIGVLLPLRELSSTSHSLRVYPQDLLVAIFQAATRAGLRVIPLSFPPAGTEPLPLSSVTDRQVDGVILGAIYNTEFTSAVEAAGVPCVEVSGFGRYVVTPDNEGGAAAAVEHLASLGHQRIAHWHGGGGVAAAQRAAGFERATQRLRLTGHIVRNTSQATELLRLPAAERPTALFAFNDYLALMTLDVVRTAGLRVPEDFSVVGFDDNIFSETSRPQLTTIRNPLEEQADAAVLLLLARLQGEEPESPQVIVPTHLVIRASTTVAPAVTSSTI